MLSIRTTALAYAADNPVLMLAGKRGSQCSDRQDRHRLQTYVRCLSWTARSSTAESLSPSHEDHGHASVIGPDCHPDEPEHGASWLTDLFSDSALSTLLLPGLPLLDGALSVEPLSAAAPAPPVFFFFCSAGDQFHAMDGGQLMAVDCWDPAVDEQMVVVQQLGCTPLFCRLWGRYRHDTDVIPLELAYTCRPGREIGQDTDLIGVLTAV